MKRLLLLMALCVGGTAGASAEIGFELYSWRAGSQWNYAIFEGTSSARTPQIIRAPRTRLRDNTFLKGRIASLPSGDKLYWREDPKRGFRLPPQEVVSDIEQFAASSHIALFLPGETQDSKTLKNLQGEARDILDLGH
jgi:hypothetical protein